MDFYSISTMIKKVIKGAIGLVAAFVVQAALRSGFQISVGTQMLDAAAWTPGIRPPDAYMIATVLAALAACGLAGIVAALIVGRARFRHALAYGALFVALAAWANRATLLGSPHPYEWPLILAPLIAMPLGAWLIIKLKPPAPSVAA